ncbi:MAG: PA2779 family protein [Desulfohalobiaceae bacterium]
MHSLIAIRKPVAMVLVFALFTVFAGLGPAYASMIGTSEVLETESSKLDKERILNALQREEVRQKLQSWGVEPDTAEARVQALTDRELARIAQRMENLPAGGDAFGGIVGAAVFVFLVLLFTDIVGATDVFPFVKK